MRLKGQGGQENGIAVAGVDLAHPHCTALKARRAGSTLRMLKPRTRNGSANRLLAILGVAVAAGVLALAVGGRVLVVADPLLPSRAIVVLGGHMPFRAIEAASIFHQGSAPEVWLTRGIRGEEERALGVLGVQGPREEIYNRQVLERLGVPANAIKVLPGQNINTVDEVRTIAKELRRVGGSRVIVVTSKSHTRRARTTWHKVVGDQSDVIVRYAVSDPFDPIHWWRTTQDSLAVAREWFGLFNAWSGFPVPSR